MKYLLKDIVKLPMLNKVGNPNKHYLNGLKVMRDEIGNIPVEIEDLKKIIDKHYEKIIDNYNKKRR